MFNLVVLTGRLTASPELKHTQKNIAVTSFTIAVDRYVKDKEKQTDFINCVAWRNTAEFVTKYFQKGSLIGIQGSIQTRKYTDKETGKARTAFEIVTESVDFVGSKSNSGNTENAPQSKNEDNTPTFDEVQESYTEDLPF